MKAYTDGACRISNPGLCSCAWVLYLGGVDDISIDEGYYLGPELHTNNYAEYMGLCYLLEYLIHHNLKSVVIHCDSKLVVNQVNQAWAINDAKLREMATKAYGLIMKGSHTLVHIKGHSGDPGNERADRLCNEILDRHMEEYENYIAAKN